MKTAALFTALLLSVIAQIPNVVILADTLGAFSSNRAVSGFALGCAAAAVVMTGCGAALLRWVDSTSRLALELRLPVDGITSLTLVSVLPALVILCLAMLQVLVVLAVILVLYLLWQVG